MVSTVAHLGWAAGSLADAWRKAAAAAARMDAVRIFMVGCSLLCVDFCRDLK